MTKFPALLVLGFSMNLIDRTPLNAPQAADSVQAQNRILAFDQQYTIPVTVDGKTYDVPEAITVSNDIAGTVHETFINFGSGDEALAAFKANLSLLPPLFSINGGTSLLGPVAKLHSPGIRYSYYSYRESRYVAKLGDCEKYLNHSLLLEGISQLPTPFNGEDQNVKRKYKDFFASYGTHVVTAVEYGSIFQLVSPSYSFFHDQNLDSGVHYSKHGSGTLAMI
ncbi:hypothetical protein AAF712_010121 [Marasmius tenuissimus]|uniref:MACPF domain-containing protein n=1 Tax=Marasmius tenuissimus TaxID=585030 RepID=A0ABR2ZP06_9AGAR